MDGGRTTANSATARAAWQAACVGAPVAAAWSAYYMLGRVKRADVVSGADFAAQFLHTWFFDLITVGSALLLIALGLRALPTRPAARRAGLVLIVVLAAALSLAVFVATHSQRMYGWHMTDAYWPRYIGWHLMLSALLVAVMEYLGRSERAEGVLQDAELAGVRLQAELDDARLQLLRAQIEPHFLFNSLANLRRLLRTDASAAGAMLADLLRYLEEALPRLRAEQSTLGQEVELVRAFLAVHQVRMGERLRTAIDVPAELAGREVPSMMLITLVENALQHGLQPLVGGGQITLRARAEADGRLHLSVADTGRGMGSGSGHGTGLANIRGRLRAMYGAAAQLSLRLNEPQGVVAEISLPEARA